MLIETSSPNILLTESSIPGKEEYTGDRQYEQLLP